MSEYVESHVNLRPTFAAARLSRRRFALPEAADRAKVRL